MLRPDSDHVRAAILQSLPAGAAVRTLRPAEKARAVTGATKGVAGRAGNA